MQRKLLAEALGSMLLSATVVGSGIMAEQLSVGNTALALLANTLATAAALVTLIALFAPISGGHFNPVVSISLALLGKHTWKEMLAYSMTQILFCCAGCLLAHGMFGLPLIQVATHARTGMAQWLAEVVATAGLLLVVLGHRRAEAAAWMVAGWITAAYWFTSSTSFANPAITIARSLTNSFSGIRIQDAPGFIIAQCTGALLATLISKYQFDNKA